MNRLFLGNFDFEEQLYGDFQRPAKLERLIDEMASCWLAVADAEDRIWCPAQLPAGFLDSLSRWNLPPTIFVNDTRQIPTGMELVPWGWSPAAIEFATRHDLEMHHPALEVVRLANSREYSVSLESSLTENPASATLCRSMDEVQDRIESLAPKAKWIIKANWSHAARERILGQGRHLTPSATAWIAQRLTRDGVVSWERWLQRESEIGIQWHITPGQSPQLIAVTELLADHRGQYAGTRPLAHPDTPPDWISQTVEVTQTAVTELAARGYFGPVGIDAMRYFDPVTNTSRTRPLQDINARWTMGRLAAGWFQKLGQSATWKHGTPAERFGDPGSHPPVATSPDCLDGSPVSHLTWLTHSCDD